jgi:hypothetical protein
LRAACTDGAVGRDGGQRHGKPDLAQGEGRRVLAGFDVSGRKFNRKRRRIKLDFDQLYSLLASDVRLNQIAKVGGVTKRRINAIYEVYFRDLFGIGPLERARRIDHLKRTKVANEVARAIAADPVLRTIQAPAARVAPKRAVRSVLLKRSGDPAKRYRHNAVLVDGKLEAVHHIQKARRGRGRTISYAATTLYRTRLQRGGWSIFVVDVRGFGRRVFRSRNRDLLRTLFAGSQNRVTAYIPLAGRPDNPRHDFLSDEENWLDSKP